MLKVESLIKNTPSTPHQCLEFENIYTLTTLNITYKNYEKNNASETCQDESGLLKVLNTEDKKNEKFNSTENLHNCEKQGNVLEGNNSFTDRSKIRGYICK